MQCPQCLFTLSNFLYIYFFICSFRSTTTSSSATWSSTSCRPGTSPWGTTTATLTPLLKFTCSQAEGESMQGQAAKHSWPTDGGSLMKKTMKHACNSAACRRRRWRAVLIHVTIPEVHRRLSLCYEPNHPLQEVPVPRAVGNSGCCVIVSAYFGLKHFGNLTIVTRSNSYHPWISRRAVWVRTKRHLNLLQLSKV